MHARLSALAAAVLLVALAPAAAAAGDGEARRVIEWSGTVTLDEEFRVPPDATLVVRSGARVEPSDPALGAPGHVVVEGRLLVEGSADAPVLLRARVSLLGAGADGSLVRHADFDGAGGGACALRVVDASLRVEASTFTNHTRALCVAGGSVVVANAVFLHNGFLGVPYEGDAPEPCAPDVVSVAPDGHEVRRACPRWPSFDAGPPGSRGACWRTWSGEPLCRATGGAQAAVAVERGRVIVEDSVFTANYGGVDVEPGAGAVVRASEFRDNDFGLIVDAAADADGSAERVLVQDSLFEGHGDPDEPRVLLPRSAGLEVWRRDGAAAGLLVRNSTFRANGVGVQVFDGADGIRVEGSTLADNGVGLANGRGRASVADTTFENRAWDLWLAGGRDRVALEGVALDESKVFVHEDRRSLARVTLAVALASSVALLLAALTDAGRWVGTKGLLVAGFARLARGDLLRHGTRERLLARVTREPGAHLRALAKDAGSYGAAVYHLARLEREGFVRSARDGVHRRFYPAEAAAPEDSRIAPVARALIELATERPGVRLAEAARALGVSKQLASYHALALAERGLLALEPREGGGRALMPTAARAGARE